MNINILDLVINEKLKQIKTEENFEDNRLQLELPVYEDINHYKNKEEVKEESRRVITIEI
jgi:CRISPR/Cas system CMR-associated protein Cmr1 (group 7 of RAMP superfamily)